MQKISSSFKHRHQHYCFLSLGIIFSLIIFGRVCRAQLKINGLSLSPHNFNYILQSLQEGIDSVGEKLKSDLNDKFLKLSSQLDQNDRKVSKTLSIFEKEWNEKAERLTTLEERQQRAEVSIMKLTKMVHELESSHNRLKNRVESSTSTPWIPPKGESTTTEKFVISTGRVTTINPRVEDDYYLSSEEDEYDMRVRPTYSATNPPAYEVQNDAAYYVYGSPTYFKTLEKIPESEQPELSTIELHYVNVDPEILKASLQNCSKLRSLKLYQVKFNDELNENSRVVLPNLEEFVLDQVGVLTFRNDTIFSKWTEIDEFLKGLGKAEMKNLIFFDKNKEQVWDVDRVSSLGTNIQILIDGVRIFSLNYETGELNSMLKYTNDFLKNLDPSFLLKKTAISAWRLDLALLPTSVTHLNLNYVLDSNEISFSKQLQKLWALQDLNIFIGNQQQFGWSLAAIPTLQLKNLTIRYSDISEFPTTRLVRLDHLYLHLCKFDQDFVQAFPKVFESIHIGVTFRRDNTSSGLHHIFLRNILNTPVLEIFMQNFDRNSTQRIGVTNLRVFRNIEYFLGNTGIGKDAENFILEKVDGKWYGRELGYAELTLKTLQLVGTDKFVTYEAYKKIIQ